MFGITHKVFIVSQVDHAEGICELKRASHLANLTLAVFWLSALTHTTNLATPSAT